MTGKPWRPSIPKEDQEKLDEHEASVADRFPGLPDLGPRHFDRAGNPMTLGEWAEAMNDEDYRRVAEDKVGDIWISTVWLGHVPIIFETMVFDQSEEAMKRWEKMVEEGKVWFSREFTGEALDYQDRYATEEQALKGHRETVVAVEADLVKHEESE